MKFRIDKGIITWVRVFLETLLANWRPEKSQKYPDRKFLVKKILVKGHTQTNFFWNGHITLNHNPFSNLGHIDKVFLDLQFFQDF